MPTKRLVLLLWLLLLSVIMVACRREEPMPTPTNTPVADVGTETETETETDATPTPRPTAAATTGSVSVIDPADIDWPPQVVYSSPQPGEEALLDGAITIRFDQPMDQASVERALLVAAADEPGDRARGAVSWPRPDTLVFTPAASLERSAVYRVSISEDARGANGQNLTSAASFELQTVGYLAVSQVLPADGVAEVQTDGAITVLFNRPVVPLVSTSQQASLPQPLTITPDLPGQGEWVSTSIYRFVPDPAFAGATNYEVTIAAGLEDITGGLLAEDYSWQFTTVSPSLVSSLPENNAQQVDPDGDIVLTFNMPMNEAAAETAIVLTASDGTPAAVDFAWSDDSREVTVSPQARLNLGTTYRLTIGEGALSATGAAGFDRTTTVRLTTVPFPDVVHVDPGRGSIAPAWMDGIQIQFASPMDMSTLDGKVIISPAPDPDDVDYIYNEYDLTNLYIRVPFTPDTNYQVTVPATAADPYGNTLGEAYTWSFASDRLPPLVSLNLPDRRVAQLSRSFPSNVEIAYRGVSQVDVNLYNLGLPLDLLAEPGRVSYDYFPVGQRRSFSVATENVDTAAVLEVALADGGVLENGVYFLGATSPGLDPDNRWWQNQASVLIVADTNLVVKEMYGSVYVWATSLDSGLPAAGLPLTAYDYYGRVLGSATTDANGLAAIEYTPTESYLAGLFVVSSEPGATGFGVGSSTWDTAVTPWEFGLPAEWSPDAPLFAYIFTDRPIYRPGDTVNFRGIVREPNNGRYQLPSRPTVTIEILPYFYTPEVEGFSVTETYELDDAGGFSGTYVLSEEISLGSYAIQLNINGYGTAREFTVADYRAPEFQVAVAAAESDLLRGETVDVTVAASYFFGGPATDLPVSWSVMVESYYLPWDGPYFSFSDDSTFFYDPYAFNFGGQYLIGGEGVTDGNGELVITLPADLLDEVPEGSRSVMIEVQVRDLSEFPVSARTTVNFHAAEAYAGIVPQDYLGRVGLESSFDLLSVDWAGAAVPDQSVEVVYYQREWEPVREEIYGQFATRWQPIDTEVARETLTTDDDGEAVASFVPPEGGTYYVAATLTDDGGRRQTSSTFFWVIDDSYSGWRSSQRERRMDLVADQPAYEVGQTAQILVQSPFTEPVEAWLTIERGDYIEQQVVTLDGSSTTLSIPVEPIYAPNVFVSVVAVKGVDGSDFPYADIRLGIVELTVNPTRLALNVDITPGADQLEPRDTAIFDIRVTDYLGQPVSADVAVSLVDLAVLSLKADNAPDIVDAFYYPQPMRSRLGGGLFVSGEGLVLELPEAVGGFGGGGGGDGALEAAPALARDEEAGADDVRSDFRDTAYWNGRVTTDTDGHATVEIDLPDNLTTWDLHAKAVTADDSLVGQNSAQILVTKPLLLRPVTPRFFTAGDVVEIGAIVNNNTGSAQMVEVSLEAAGVSLEDAAVQEATVANGAARLFRWTVRVADVEFVDLTFRVSAGDFSDATKPTFGIAPDQLIPVYRYDAEDVVGTSGVIEASGRQVEAILLPPALDDRQGQVTIELSASLAAALFDALDYNYDETYEPVCAHATADRLFASAALLRAIEALDLDEPVIAAQTRLAITTDVARLNSLAKNGGGWGWCYAPESDPYITGYVLLALVKAAEVGYPAEEAVVNSAVRYLNRRLVSAASLTDTYLINRQAFFVYVLAEQGEDVAAEADDLFDEHRALLDPYAKALLILAYERSGATGNNQQALLSDLNDQVVLSAAGAHWEDVSTDFRNLNSDVRGTAVIIDALALVDPDNLLAPQAVRWLMAARQATHWETSHENAWSIFALTDWVLATDELNANFSYTVLVNGAQYSLGQFSAENIAESRGFTVGLDELILDAVNFVEFQHGRGDGRLYYTAYLDAFVAAESVSAVSRGFTVQRVYYDADCDPAATTCAPISSIGAGERVRVELTVIVPNDQIYVRVEDPIPAGAQAQDPNLATSASGTGGSLDRVDEYEYGYWGWWYFDRIEYRDEKVVFYSSYLPAGTYQYTYYLETYLPGVFQVMPTTARSDFFPDVFGRADGMRFEID